MKSENIYFKFVSDGSTNIACYYNVKTFSVKNDTKWHRKLKHNKINLSYIPKKE